MQLYIYPGTSVVNYVQDESKLDIESRSRNSTEFDFDMLSNQRPVNHTPEPEHHHSLETETDKKHSGPQKQLSTIYHQDIPEPHQITHDIHEHHPKPDYKPHQTKVVSQEKQYSEEPHHTPSTHEIHEHHIPHEQSKLDHKPEPTKIFHQEKKPDYYQEEAHDPHHNHEIHEHHAPHHAVLPIGENDKNWE